MREREREKSGEGAHVEGTSDFQVECKQIFFKHFLGGHSMQV